MQDITITHTDRERHPAFHDFVRRVFPSISFESWAAHGGWDAAYRVFALLEGDRIVASASLQRVDVILHGRPVRGWQLGAVGTDPAYRQKGLQRRVLARLLAEPAPEDLVFLFANDSVLDFYPRFGFQRHVESVFGARYESAPSGVPLRTLQLDRGGDRALLARLAARAEPLTSSFGARKYGSTLLWYFCNFHGDGLRYSPELDCIFVSEQSATTLTVYDVVAPAPVDLRPHIPQLIHSPVDRVEFLFAPGPAWWPDAKPLRDYSDSPLFVRGPHRMPELPFKFPALAQT